MKKEIYVVFGKSGAYDWKRLWFVGYHDVRKNAELHTKLANDHARKVLDLFRIAHPDIHVWSPWEGDKISLLVQNNPSPYDPEFVANGQLSEYDKEETLAGYDWGELEDWSPFLNKNNHEVSLMAKGIRKRVLSALDEVKKEIAGNSYGKYGSGLAGEGRAGGYAQALRDVLLLLDGIEPGLESYFRKSTPELSIEVLCATGGIRRMG